MSAFLSPDDPMAELLTRIAEGRSVEDGAGRGAFQGSMVGGLGPARDRARLLRTTDPSMLAHRQEAESRFPGLRDFRDIHVLENREQPAFGEYYSEGETHHTHPKPGFPVAWVGREAGMDLPVPEPGPADIIANAMLHGVLERDPVMARLKAEIAVRLDPNDFRGMYERKIREGHGSGAIMESLESFVRGVPDEQGRILGGSADGIISGYVRGEPEWVEYVENRPELKPFVQEIQQRLLTGSTERRGAF